MVIINRVIWHWTAGAKGMLPLEARRYNAIVQHDGTVQKGYYPLSAQTPPLRGAYAAHTRKANSYAAGIAIDCMAGAEERPFDPGPNPLTWAAINGMLLQTAAWCRQYKIPVTRKTTLSHAEVQPTLGIRQENKWDITWLPDMKAPGDAVEVGDRLRKMLLDRM